MSSPCECLKNNCYSNTPVFNRVILETEKQETPYAEMLLDLLSEKVVPGPRTYGFEYEFISRNPLNINSMKKLYMFLPEKGFIAHGSSFLHESGMYIDFEPGGQIEFHTPPLLPEDNTSFNNCLKIIKDVIGTIYEKLNIEYIASAYIPDRKDSPLCLDADRYINLHNRLSNYGTRGLEMMKGTASIHFHAGIKSIEEFPGLFSRLIDISGKDDFKMGRDRMDIWRNTDSGRCGQPFLVDEKDTPLSLIHKIVDHSLQAEHIAENKPFLETSDLSFEAFKYHLTTIFTDIRINLKGPSIELRTIDTVPFDQFKSKWYKFIALMENK
jgi:glutamate--cysteine ligase